MTRPTQPSDLHACTHNPDDCAAPRRSTRIRRSVVLALCAAAGAAVAGPLVPPPGPVSSTMRPLDQVEPRASVNDLPGDATAAHVISAPGNYILTADILAAAGQDGIRIDAASATLDLNGFSVTGQSGSGNGISATFINGRYVLRSGAPATISGFDADGIHIENAERLELENLRVDGNGGDAIEATGRASASSTLRADSISAIGNAGTGLVVTDFCTYRILKGEFRDNGEGARCTSNTPIQNARTQIHVHDSMFTGNITDGLSVVQNGDESISISYDFDDFTANGGSGVVIRKTRANSVHVRMASVDASKNGAHGVDVRGITLDESEDMTMDAVYASGNGADGVHVEHYQLRLHDATTNRNVGHGVVIIGDPNQTMDESIDDLRSSGNGGDGLHVEASRLRVSGATLTGNLGDGAEWAPGEPVKGINVSLEQIAGVSNGGSGLHFRWTQVGGPISAVVTESSLTDNAIDGMRVTGSPTRRASVDMERTALSSNAGDGAHVVSVSDFGMSRCSSNNNGGNGVLCDASQLAGPFKFSTREGELFSNGANGVVVVRGTGSAVTELATSIVSRNILKGYFETGSTPTEDQFSNLIDSSITNNGDDGVYVAVNPGPGAGRVTLTAERCVSSANGNQGWSIGHLQDARLTGCSGSGNVVSGFFIADADTVSVRDSDATNNGAYGLVTASTIGISSRCVSVRGCSFDANVLAGLSISDSLTGRVTECTAFSNGTTGIEVLALNHVITDNTAGGNAANYSVALPGNAVGSLVDQTNISQSDSSSNRAP